MSACHHNRLHSLLKTVLGKIGDWYQAYCTTYKTHTMTTHHGGAGYPLDRGLDILTEDPEHTDINNGSTHSSDATVALGGPEKVGHTKDPAYNAQDRLKALAREINDLCQRVAAGEGQSVEILDHWLIDIEMAAELTSESRARLAKVKSQGLTCTLVTEAISLNKPWEEIRDLVRLKLYNADINMYTSQFMEIQQ